MPRFVFQLQPVLEQRKREERAHMLSVAACERERIALAAEAEATARAADDERRALRTQLSGGADGLDPLAVRWQANASIDRFRRMRELANQLEGVRKRLDSARAMLARASSRRRAVELLRERRYQAWLADQAAREARDLDELTTSRFRPGRRVEEFIP